MYYAWKELVIDGKVCRRGDAIPVSVNDGPGVAEERILRGVRIGHIGIKSPPPQPPPQLGDDKGGPPATTAKPAPIATKRKG
jgi:hypothetical protein